MDPKSAIMVGMVIGIVLFFLLERSGLLYKWFGFDK
jgi:hypothetical protein